MQLLIYAGVVWIVAVSVAAKPGYHFKTHHKHSISRDLSKHTYNIEEAPEEEDKLSPFEDNSDPRYDSHPRFESTVHSETSDDETKGDEFWQSWEPTHEDNVNDDDRDALLGEELQDDLHRPTEKHEPTQYDPCKNTICHYGRVCRVQPDGKPSCDCADESFCQGHSKKVCGDDGQWYSSHCELHRQACLQRHHIKVDHSTQACEADSQDETDETRHVPFDYVDILPAPEKRDKQNPKSRDPKISENETLHPPSKEPGFVQDRDAIAPSPVQPIEEEIDEVEEEGDTLKCTDEEYAHLKRSLLQYHCSRIGETNCFTSAESKQFVVNIMFNYYDRSSDLVVDMDELKDVEERDHLSQLSLFCSLADIMIRDDFDGDTNITLHEFFIAFEVSMVHLEEDLREFSSTVTTGNSIELKCDIKGATEIVWKRNGGLLDELPNDEIKVFKDGSLYIGHIGLHHMGNYSCQDKFNDQVIQTHMLKVQMEPIVKVSPATQYHPSGSSVALKCLANGVPAPRVSWERNDHPLPKDPRHYTLLYSNSTLQISGASYESDTGAYKCIARNDAGSNQDIATIFIDNAHLPKYSEETGEKFIVFHDQGYTVYDPRHCYMQHQVSGAFTNFLYKPHNTITIRMCEEGKTCEWAHAVNVQNKLAYVSQPTLNRILVISLDGSYNPVEIVNTDITPVKLSYVEQLDQVWIVSWNGPENTGVSTLMVIEQASKRDIQHETLYINADSDSFIMGDLFVPPHNDLENKLNFGYVTRPGQQSLYKLDLKKMMYVKRIELDEYHCVPQSASFVPFGGKVMVYCESPEGQPPKSSRLILDFITDKVLDYVDLAGEPYVSPDGRRVVTIDRSSNTLAVFKVNDVGKLEHVFDEYTSFHMSDITFYPSERERGYDFFATSTDRNDVLYVNLASGKIEVIEGVGKPPAEDDWKWSPYNRAIATGGHFTKYLTTPSNNAVVVIDGVRRQVQCEWQNVHDGNVIVWVESQKTHQ